MSVYLSSVFTMLYAIFISVFTVEFPDDMLSLYLYLP